MNKLIKFSKLIVRKLLFLFPSFEARILEFVYFYRNLKWYFKFKYTVGQYNTIQYNTIYYIIHKDLPQTGFADRIKVAVCLYYIAKQNDFQFKMIFDYPFKLSEYFTENKTKWIGNFSDLDYSIKSSRIISYNSLSGKLPKLSKKIKQYHIYNYDGGDLLITSKIQNHKIIAHQCFHELFMPTVFLKQLLQEQLFKENEYYAAHFRFVNALQKIENGYDNSLDEKGKQILINKCILMLKNLGDNKKNNIVVFSDSTIFLKEAEKAGFRILEGNIGHISFSNEKEVAQKTVIDFCMLSGAKKIYSIASREKSKSKFPVLFTSAFPHYAAIAGNKPFERVYID
jgi:hypothetical protein